ncbi:MAG: type IV secretion system protein VirB10 [Pseudomonadota bacterium]
MSTDERRINQDSSYAGPERRARLTPLQRLSDFAARKFRSDEEVDADGLPSVGRRKGNSKLVNMLGMVVIVVFGIAMAMAVNGGDKDKKSKKKEKVEGIANNLPPLVVPAAPPRPHTEPPALLTSTPPGGMGPGGARPIAMRGGQGADGGADAKRPPTWQERKMGGSTLVAGAAGSGGGTSSVSHISAAMAQAQPAADDDGAMAGAMGQGARGGNRNDLAARLDPTTTIKARAELLPDRNFVIAKGASLDCALETALDSTVPGMTTCRLTRDVYSDNGQVVLLDRGTQLVGEYQGGIKQGQARLFVLWTRAKTPNGVIVNLNSPGADALGRSGHEGWVDTHFLDRFGAALMISLIKDSYALLIARQSRGEGSTQNTLVLGNTARESDRMAEKALESSVNIPPTLMKNQGDHIQVMLARDLDFSTVYGLRGGR